MLDASALLAYLQGEPGSEAVEAALPTAIMSVVNVAEVASKLIDRGFPAGDIAEMLGELLFETWDADLDLAFRAGAMRAESRLPGLSLGDRFCLSLAEATSLPALTADRAWADLDSKIDIRLIR